MYCPNCGVELENNMTNCPLCGTSLTGESEGVKIQPANFMAQHPYAGPAKMSRPQKKFAWDIVSIILLSAAIASFAVDFIISRNITWSEFTMAIGLTIFSYISLFAFWEQRTVMEIIGGFVVSSVFLVLLDALTKGIDWSIRLAIPLLLAANIILIFFVLIVRNSKFKGINLIGYGFIASAILCICIEAILDYYVGNSIQLRWSIIVAACAVPVAIVLFFVHYRFKKGRDLKKTFHI